MLLWLLLLLRHQDERGIERVSNAIIIGIISFVGLAGFGSWLIYETTELRRRRVYDSEFAYQMRVVSEAVLRAQRVMAIRLGPAIEKAHRAMMEFDKAYKRAQV